MSKIKRAKYFYNSKTLRYERVKLSFLNVGLITLSYAAFGIIFFVGLVLLENYFFETPLEKELKEENIALASYKTVLTNHLTESSEKLNKLKTTENGLYRKLFESKKPEEVKQDSIHEEILLSTPSTFMGYAEQLNKNFLRLNQKAKITNHVFGQTAKVKKEDFEQLRSLPSVAPVDSFDVAQVVSGFGNRVNPFHKGIYHHDGLDISATTGSSVLAAGAGQVVAVSNSSLVGGYGNYIEISHGYGYVTRYSHLGQIHVRHGQKVSRGQVIGLTGISGGSVAPHLHYEVIKDGKFINPVKFIVAGLNSSQYDELVRRSNYQNQSLD